MRVSVINFSNSVIISITLMTLHFMLVTLIFAVCHYIISGYKHEIMFANIGESRI